MLKKTTRRFLAAVAAIAAGLLVALPALASPLVSETFSHPTVTDPNWVAGGTGFTACLTAGSNTSQTPVPGCGGTTDADGSGVLRLTEAVGGEAGFLLYNKAQPLTAGLTVDFNVYQWGGSGADGVSFFLVDGSSNLTQPGSPGGGLGYSSGASGTTPGVNNGMVGIGFDAWGNYITDGADGTDCSHQHNAQAASVAIRGPGNNTTGYCLLGFNSALPGSLRGSTRALGKRPVHVVIDPSTVATPKITVSMDFGSGLVQVLQTNFPQTGATTFKFGFAGSTGAVTDFHEISDLVSSTQLALPKLSMTKTHGGSFVRGSTGTYTLTVSTDPSAGAELQPVFVTDPLPTGISSTLAATAPGWSCGPTLTPPGATPNIPTTSWTCIYQASATSPIPPGTTLPTITLPVNIAATAPSSVTNTASVTSGDSTGGPVLASDVAGITSAPAPAPILPRAGQARSGPATGAIVAVLVAVLMAGLAVWLGWARRRKA